MEKSLLQLIQIGVEATNKMNKTLMVTDHLPFLTKAERVNDHVSDTQGCSPSMALENKCYEVLDHVLDDQEELLANFHHPQILDSH